MFEYACYPMEKLSKDETFYNYLPGSHVTAYLEAFSTHKVFAGKTLKDRVILNSHVKNIIKANKVWIISTESDTSFTCEKLIIATGLTSTPNLPSFPIDHSSTPAPSPPASLYSPLH
jgi:dimethylaniline monooxygenase (N-oxide forming)